MTVRIKKVSDSLYTADLILPDMPGIKASWSTPEPMRVDQIVEELRSRGVHQIDIGDAFYEADPRWLTAFGIGSAAKGYVCREVLDKSQPILLVSRNHEDWLFLCGAGHSKEASEYTLLAVGYLINSDRTLLALRDLPIGWKAERKSANSPWIRSPLDSSENLS
jgi:hypothetical protein